MKLIHFAALGITAAIAFPSIASANAAAESRFENRLQDLNQRVDSGISDGTITPPEFIKYEQKSDNIFRQYVQDKTSGGSLDLSEVADLEQKLDQLEYWVYAAKQN
ncbi:MAG: hypothetical protein WA902_24735 [Thermosynechococcaceae cyanobacterium]